MARLVDLVEREAVKDAIGFMNLHFLGHGDNKSLLDSINEVPSVDAVPVVRCKDCVWGTVPYGDEEDGWTECTNLPGRPMMRDESFCSYGERKDNEVI